MERWALSALRSAGEDGEVSRLRVATDAELYAGARLVLKVHRPGTDRTQLEQRVSAARQLGRWLLPPATETVLTAPDGRLGTIWPRVAVLGRREAVQPWAEAGAVLAGLHSASPPRLPAVDPRTRLQAALSTLAAVASPEAVLVRTLGEELLGRRLEWRRGSVVHGDWHLGQLGRLETTEGARLVLLDVDDLGTGDPAWDLGRPAGLWAAGLLADEDWIAFLDAYRDAGGRAVPDRDRPWHRLEEPARAAVLTATARSLTSPGTVAEEEQAALLEACRAMARPVP